jgi:type IV pilus assembly protein PilC
MDFAYVAYTEDKRLVRGKVTATNEDAATELLTYGGYRVVSLKSAMSLINKEKLLSLFHRIKPQEIVMFSRQLALLLESGTDIVTSFDLLQEQIDNQTLRGIIGQVASDIRSGTSLSVALSKHPRAFSEMYYRTIAAGEQGGNLEIVLRQMAEHIEKGVNIEKKIKGALTYPVIVVVVAVVVVSIMVTFVLPTFTDLYLQFGVELPLPTRMIIGFTEWANNYGLYVLLGLVAAVGAGYGYIRTPVGKYRWDKALLGFPVIGRIIHLSELSRSCRTMALLLKVGLPLPEVLVMTIRGSSNKAVIEAMSGVQQELIRGEGLSRPMAKRRLFLPLMTQMVKVGEETGSLDNTLTTVADSFEVEANDKTSAAIGLIQPILTIVMGSGIGFIILGMFSAMYSVYGQINP